MAQGLADSDIERLVGETRRQLQACMEAEDEGQSALRRVGRVAAGQNVARLIDHTLLKPDASAEQITQLCREAREYHFATVCVNSARVSLAAELLRGSDVAVCAVVGFPLGASLPEAKSCEARLAIAAGAGEIDMVLNSGALRDRDLGALLHDIRRVVAACHERDVPCKVILETALLSDEEKVHRLRSEPRGGRGLREDQHRLRRRRRDCSGRRADAARGGAGHGREGLGRGALVGGCTGHGGGGGDAHRGQRGRGDCAGGTG